MENNNEEQLFLIPKNYKEGGRLFGGKVDMRTAIETGVFALFLYILAQVLKSIVSGQALFIVITTLTLFFLLTMLVCHSVMNQTPGQLISAAYRYWRADKACRYRLPTRE